MNIYYAVAAIYTLMRIVCIDKRNRQRVVILIRLSQNNEQPQRSAHTKAQQRRSDLGVGQQLVQFVFGFTAVRRHLLHKQKRASAFQ